jgi:hypothetical protein
MKMASAFVLMASFLGHANADASCSKLIDSEDYVFAYDGCVLEMEKSAGPDFYLYSIRRKIDPSRPLFAIYLGGAPDVQDFYDDKEKIIEKSIEKMKIEARERQGADGGSYEALIALPVNSTGRVNYFHVMSEKLATEDLDLVKKIVFSIRAK